LAHLGYGDPAFYLRATETFMRYGFKDFSQLEPILQGLCITAQCPPAMVRALASHVGHMAHSMSLHQVERANRYMVRLNCEDDWVFKQLAARVFNFVKEVTPEMPQEMQVLLQRGAPDPVASTP
jgi:hypothetical protein